MVRRNDLGQYDDLEEEWWRPGGALAMLAPLARSRAALVPPARREGAVLVDLGCGGGLFAPAVAPLGYRHVGIDLVASALKLAAGHGVTPVRADVAAVPLIDGCADVVAAGEVLEHVPDARAVIREACRILRPGGTLVLDTINSTRLARFMAVTVAERVPGGPPRGIHDPRLFVAPRVLIDECARGGVNLTVRGIRPHLRRVLRWSVTREGDVPMVPTWTTAVLYQGWGVKES
jgi:2-polyprenyl-6-hydroxyphenyl methylase/3-demethylubiquinone-9 3-methyltransferase